ncbi:hypothetical protein KIPB_014903, partial [Kipferlia bialata]|eukprot:g14903.t1
MMSHQMISPHLILSLFLLSRFRMDDVTSQDEDEWGPYAEDDLVLSEPLHSTICEGDLVLSEPLLNTLQSRGSLKKSVSFTSQ